MKAGERMIGKINWKCIQIFLVILECVFGNSPQRMDIFDKSGNCLMFVEFEYDDNGNNISRSVFAADSTFLRKTSIVKDASGLLRENSLNFNDDTIGYTNFMEKNSRTEMQVFDQFGLNQFGAPVSYTINDKNEYDIYHNGQIVNKMKYYYDVGGALNRVDINDINGQMLYYASFSSTVKTRNYKVRTNYKPVITFYSNHCRLSIELKKESLLKVCIFNVSGQLVSVPISKMYKAGHQNIQFKIADTKTGKLVSGMYILRFYIDGKEAATPQKYIGNMGRR